MPSTISIAKAPALPSALGFGLHLQTMPTCPRCGQPLVATEAPGISSRWDCPRPLPRGIRRKGRNIYTGCGWMGPEQPWPEDYEAAVRALWEQQREALSRAAAAGT